MGNPFDLTPDYTILARYYSCKFSWVDLIKARQYTHLFDDLTPYFSRITLMNEFEERLLKHGFSYKDLQKLQQITRNTEFETSTLQSLIIDLSKRFWGGVIGGFILVIIAVYGITHSDEADLLSYFIALGFGFLVIYFVTPMRLSWKAYTFIKKNHY